MLPTEPTISQSNFYNTLARLWKGKIYARRHRQACRPAVLRQSCRAAAQRWSEETAGRVSYPRPGAENARKKESNKISSFIV